MAKYPFLSFQKWHKFLHKNKGSKLTKNAILFLWLNFGGLNFYTLFSYISGPSVVVHPHHGGPHGHGPGHHHLVVPPPSAAAAIQPSSSSAAAAAATLSSIAASEAAAAAAAIDIDTYFRGSNGFFTPVQNSTYTNGKL